MGLYGVLVDIIPKVLTRCHRAERTLSDQSLGVLTAKESSHVSAAT